ncbi:MAG: undecaprenyldiphospho-muramoylpentapeptide beta-N-acetylglucosaminyltransferase [Nitrospira sp.]|nr:undecaprenyldiphospho-muramoylpentapeptide beta-N-acetylglucosaminyltransferase [Candidatus Manganitrophaceae bacterium]HIL33807.1 undecaprenyldiphospho-muramoylpentapeptide beta-N-acetylglucosaminyltransferase [Candidatus Manganitrophaceae bacterium]
MKVVIAGGGTGGHLYPGIALAETFKRLQENMSILFIGTAQGIGPKVLSEKGFMFEVIRAKGLVGKGWVSRIKSIGLIPVGLIQSMLILRKFSPQLVIGIGGYAAGPILLAAILLRIKRVILEPNRIPGLANKLVAPYVDMAFVAFDELRETLGAKEVRSLGVPVRPEIVRASSSPEVLTSGKDPLVLLILGGSQGAHSINQAMVDALPYLEKLKDRLFIIHQTGKLDWEETRSDYTKTGFSSRVEPFIDDMAETYAKADLVLSRAGAGTLSELAAIGKPSLLVPFPFAGGHQEKNAEAFASAGASEMILDRMLSGQGLAERIEPLLLDSEKRKKMGEAARRRGHPDSAEKIVRECFCLLGEPLT